MLHLPLLLLGASLAIQRASIALQASSSTGGIETASPVIRALQMRDDDEAFRLLGEGAPTDERYEGKSTIHWAAIASAFRTLSSLLERGASANALDDRKRTPLHYAIIDGDPKTLAALIMKGADLSMCDDSGRTPLHFAVLAGARSTILELSYRNLHPAIHISDRNGLTALHLAAFLGDNEILARLVGTARMAARRGGMPVEHFCRLQSATGRTAIHFAALRSDPETISLLLPESDLEIRDTRGWTAKDWQRLGWASTASRLLLDTHHDRKATDRPLILDDSRAVPSITLSIRRVKPWRLPNRGAEILAPDLHLWSDGVVVFRPGALLLDGEHRIGRLEQQELQFIQKVIAESGAFELRRLSYAVDDASATLMKMRSGDEARDLEWSNVPAHRGPERADYIQFTFALRMILEVAATVSPKESVELTGRVDSSGIFRGTRFVFK
ncbi:MAG: ankyrin repeat domain-containing protein [Planctomycetes bacterium]|nr:ankyrin repeat domain-containing protein [Planctomycetota bacterium]